MLDVMQVRVTYFTHVIHVLNDLIFKSHIFSFYLRFLDELGDLSLTKVVKAS